MNTSVRRFGRQRHADCYVHKLRLEALEGARIETREPPGPAPGTLRRGRALVVFIGATLAAMVLLSAAG
jgi:hypothetical protein